MLSTRSIGGKLTCGLISLFALLLLFGATSALSWRAHSRMIRSLETSIKRAPHREDLIAAFGSLVAPLVVPTPETYDSPRLQVWAELQRDEFLGRQDDVERRVDDFHRRLEECGCLTTGSTGQHRELAILFEGVEQGFEQLRAAAPSLGEPENRARQSQWMLEITAGLIERATQMPDPAAHLLALLEEAQADHQLYTMFALGFGMGAIGVVIALAAGGYFWILKPLRALQADFDRVATGDYSHRATVSTRDEIHSLATAFNVMTTKFQDVVRNQDDQIQMQAQKLLQSERVVGVGFLATGVAHEINSPLGVIAICADSIARQFTVPSEQWKPSDYAEGREYSQMICDETERCKNITHRMLDFAHSSSGEKNFYDVTAIVREVVELVGHLGKYNDRKIVFETHHPCEAWVCGQEIRQVVLNLVANGLDATNGSGTVQVEIAESIDSVELRFVDDGCGMTPETIENLFQPFYTTKPTGEGTGLGLSISDRIVTDHGGSIEVSSAGLGCGSAFVVRLPRLSSSNVTNRLRLATVTE